jgi:hypothetical protein
LAIMSDREYFKRRAQEERAAAVAAPDVASCRIHMNMAKEYDFMAACEPSESTLAAETAGRERISHPATQTGAF